MNIYFKNLKLVLGNKRIILFYIICSFLLLSILEALGIGLIIPLISEFNMTKNSDGLNNIPLMEDFLVFFNIKNIESIITLIAFIFLFKTLSSFFLNYKINKYVFSNQRRIIMELSKSFIYSSSLEIQKKQTSEVIQNLMHNSDTVAIGTILGTLRFISETIFISIIMVTLIYIKPDLTLFMISFMIIVIVVFNIIFSKKAKKAGENSTFARIKVIKNTQILLSAHKELKIFKRFEYFNNLLSKFSKEMEKNTIIHKTLSLLPRYYIESIVMIFIILFINYYGKIGINKIDIFPILSIYIVALLRLMPSISIVISSLVQVNNSLYALKSIVKELENKNKKPSESIKIDKEKSNIKPLNIIFENVTFYYSKIEKPIFNNINLLIPSNSLLLIKGQSGSGKTTLLNLLIGVYLPKQGKIYNKKIESINNNNDWISQFAYVPQFPNIYSDTIKSNITLGISIENDNEKIDTILKMVELYDFVYSLSNKLESYIDESASNLSGGQRQRLAIARALYFNRPIIIFDEPTSALDDDTSKKIIQLIKKLTEFKTIIVASHDNKVDNICTKKLIVKDCKIYEK